MCGRFAQCSSRDEYFDSLGLKPDEITFDPEPIGRFNVAPGRLEKYQSTHTPSDVVSSCLRMVKLLR